MRNQEGIKTELQKKVHRRISVRDITFWAEHSPSYVIFVAFFIYSPSYVIFCRFFRLLPHFLLLRFYVGSKERFQSLNVPNSA